MKPPGRRFLPFLLSVVLWGASGVVLGITEAEQDNVYHGLDQIQSFLTSVANSNSGFVRADFLPTDTASYHKDIFFLKLSTGVKSSDDPLKPDVLILAGLHAREWLAVEAARMTAKYLVWSYTSCGGPPEEMAPDCEQVRYLLDHAEVWIVPVGNPDGNIYSHLHPDNKDYRFWRKNRREVEGEVRGVDINRNFGFHWDPIIQGPVCGIQMPSASDNPGDPDYRGGNAASELETVALQALMQGRWGRN